MRSLRALSATFLTTSVAVAAACGPGSTSPTPDQDPDNSYKTTIRVVSALSPQVGVSLVNVAVTGGGDRQTNDAGIAEIATAVPSTVSIRLQHPAFVERETRVQVPSTATLDVSLIPSAMDMAAFEEFAPRTTGLRRWTRNPSLVVLTNAVDYGTATNNFLEYSVTSRRISDAQLDCLTSGISASLAEMAGGHLNWASVGIRVVEAGSSFRTDQTAEGTIVVLPAVGLVVGGRGIAYLGAEPFVLTRGAVWLNAEPTQNFCLQSLIYRHELGHALGYMHVTRVGSMMGLGLPAALTEFDRNAIEILFQRPPGNATPDRDPVTISTNALRGVRPLSGEPMR